LLADEPTGNVDDRIALRLMHLFEELNKLGTTIITATHNESLVKRLGHPCLRLDNGRLLSDQSDGSADGAPPSRRRRRKGKGDDQSGLSRRTEVG